MDNRFEFGNRKFSLTKLDAFKQFHIVRRMGPTLTEVLPELQKIAGIKDFDGLPEDKKMEKLAKLATPFMTGLSKLSDEDSNYVLHGLLGSVQMNANGAWVPVYSNGNLMVADLELPALLNLAGRAFFYNLSGFFSALPQS